MLHERLREPAALAELQARWRATGSLRMEPLLAEGVCEALVGALEASPFTLLTALPPGLGFQYWAHTTTPEADCDHALCRFGVWLWSEGAALAAQITGLALEAPADRALVATWYRMGCYLDPHNDWDSKRRVAFVVGLTRDAWPAEEGGHLEFLAADAACVSVVERRAPGWNTLDLFDVRAPERRHAVPILIRDERRIAISGWFY